MSKLEPGILENISLHDCLLQGQAQMDQRVVFSFILCEDFFTSPDRLLFSGFGGIEEKLAKK